jgi:hypothetical protein
VSVGELSCDIDRAGLFTVVEDAGDDQLVTWGDADAITARVGEHVQAGADQPARRRTDKLAPLKGRGFAPRGSGVGSMESFDANIHPVAGGGEITAT